MLLFGQILSIPRKYYKKNNQIYINHDTCLFVEAKKTCIDSLFISSMNLIYWTSKLECNVHHYKSL